MRDFWEKKRNIWKLNSFTFVFTSTYWQMLSVIFSHTCWQHKQHRITYKDIVSKAHSSKMIVKASCMCESVRSSLVLLQPVTLCSEGKEDKQHNHLFSISICTLHTRSLARVKICLMLWRSAISERHKQTTAWTFLPVQDCTDRLCNCPYPWYCNFLKTCSENCLHRLYTRSHP